MQSWLYQMRSLPDWGPKDFRLEVWEGSEVAWTTGRISTKTEVQPGDLTFLFFAPSGTDDPGLCGWGLITAVPAGRVRFRPLPRTDVLKVDPIWDDAMKKIIDRIRGKVKQGTMWPIGPEELQSLKQYCADRFRE
jgi:hypothetical protein